MVMALRQHAVASGRGTFVETLGLSPTRAGSGEVFVDGKHLTLKDYIAPPAVTHADPDGRLSLGSGERAPRSHCSSFLSSHISGVG